MSAHAILAIMVGLMISLTLTTVKKCIVFNDSIGVRVSVR